MNRYLLASVLAVAAASTSVAFADDITVDPHPFHSSLTREQVQAQLLQYKAAGVNPWSTTYNPLRRFEGTRSRDEVRSEFLQARDEVSALTAEDSGSARIAAQAPRTAVAPVPAAATLVAR